MPNLTGYDIAARIVTAFGYKRPLLIAITGLTSDVHRLKAAEAGFDAYIMKPHEFDVLLEVIEDHHHRTAGEPLARLPRREA